MRDTDTHTHPLWVVASPDPGCFEKAGWAGQEEQTSKQRPPRPPQQLPLLGSCPGRTPAQIAFIMMMMMNCNKEERGGKPLQVAFGHVVTSYQQKSWLSRFLKATPPFAQNRNLNEVKKIVSDNATDYLHSIWKGNFQEGISRLPGQVCNHTPQSGQALP